jgi:Holliday junction resolvase RusA-like endonuclease
VKLVIQMEPPSGNHYKNYRVIGKFVSWYLTKEAKAWHEVVALACSGMEPVSGKTHEITYTVYQGAKSRGDVDNYAKMILDALVKAGALKSDASVVALHCYKKRDRIDPRTEIEVQEVLT